MYILWVVAGCLVSFILGWKMKGTIVRAHMAMDHITDQRKQVEDAKIDEKT